MNLTVMNNNDWKEFINKYPAAYNGLIKINHNAEVRSINHQIQNRLYFDPLRLSWLEDRLATLTHFD